MESAKELGTAIIWKVGPSKIDGSVEILALLPHSASAIEISRYEQLQSSYDGRLSVENMSGRPIIGRRFVPHADGDELDETNRFRSRLKSHMRLESALQ